MKKIDLAELNSKLTKEDIIAIMKRLGAERYEEKAGCLIFPTVCHNLHADEASMKLYYYEDNKIFHCYTGCGDSFSIFDLLVRYYELHEIEYNWYADVLDVVMGFSDRQLDNFEFVKYESKKERYRRREPRVVLPEIPVGLLDVFTKRYPSEWLYDGINKESMDRFNILFSIARNKIVIPHYDVEDRLIGIRGRALNDWEVDSGHKYMPIKIEGKMYSHQLSLNLYGLNLNKEAIRRKKYVLIFESEKSVLQCNTFYSSDENVAVACCGSNFNKMQLNLLLWECAPREVILCFDNEEEEGEDYKYFYKLRDICKKYNNYCDFSFIYDKQGLTKLKDSPSDRGREIFEKLFQQRVRVK